MAFNLATKTNNQPCNCCCLLLLHTLPTFNNIVVSVIATESVTIANTKRAIMGPYPNDKKRFGQTMKKSSSSLAGSRYQGQFGNNRGGSSHSRIAPSSSSSSSTTANTAQSLAETKAAEAAQRRRIRQEQGEAIDLLFGYPRLEDQYSSQMMNHPHQRTGGSDKLGIMKPRRGWLFQMLATTVRFENFG
jgi:hypothetical protein